ncbi:hypothetical protein DB44_AD00010 [Candidatus Protochlamydia amoebophila]|uniref:Uncharacterized protein n=1 Tax=Candidatus Protochlamydia amoebophila TaxID=362787 RepID=A0A0C1HJG5_9BACT|nr:hypothetical protein DB44_AD00010 [Candidatus Protochlamydia amoebophila]
MEQEQHHSPWLRRLYGLLRVVFIPDIEPLEKNQACLTEIRNTLKKGISVCIFVQSWDIYSEVEKLNHSTPFNHIIEEANYPIIPVYIQKGIKSPRFQFLTNSLKKFRVPASVVFGDLIYTGHQSILKSKHEHDLYFED